jgi:hypothetical protein
LYDLSLEGGGKTTFHAVVLSLQTPQSLSRFMGPL